MRTKRMDLRKVTGNVQNGSIIRMFYCYNFLLPNGEGEKGVEEKGRKERKEKEREGEGERERERGRERWIHALRACVCGVYDMSRSLGQESN